MIHLPIYLKFLSINRDIYTDNTVKSLNMEVKMESEKVYNLDVFSSIHEPYWIETTNGIKYHTLKDDINVDVAIVGGGITGLTAAFLLKNKGLKVAILEANRIGQVRQVIQLQR
jgi:hypothetical protein